MQRVVLKRFLGVLALWMMVFGVGYAFGQSTSGSVSGAVTDPNGALVSGATVEIANPVSGYSRTVTTDSTGVFHFYNMPFDQYTVTVRSPQFALLRKQVRRCILRCRWRCRCDCRWRA